MKRASVWRFFLNNIVQMPANTKSAFIELTSFKSLFLVKFQASTLDQSNHSLAKLDCKSRCENLDAISSPGARESLVGLAPNKVPGPPN